MRNKVLQEEERLVEAMCMLRGTNDCLRAQIGGLERQVRHSWASQARVC